jgi:RimJ/RimL family protein N-acetyltransferase
MSYNAWEGELVRLRGVRPDDWKTFMAWDSDSDAQRFGWMVFMPKGEEGAKQWTQEKSSAVARDGENYFLLIETLDGVPVGSLNTHGADRLNRRFEYGIHIGREHWGKGYAADAIKVICRFMFAERGYNKVNAWVYSFNERSKKMHEKLGMVHEGTSRQTHFSAGEFHDEYLMGMTAAEFFARYGRG